MPGYEFFGNEERRLVNKVFDNGNILMRHGFDHQRTNQRYFVKEFEAEFAQYMSSDHALAVSSGTAALRVALAALEIKPGDEVITQSFTFVATVEAIVESGAKPICTNIDHTLNMDPEDLLKKISKKTKAVIVVHMLGTPANLEVISNICKERDIYLIEDTAWGCGGSLKGRKLGNWGDIGTFSFDYAKAITTGEGGMLIFRDKKVYEKAAAWHDHGHENNPNLPRWKDSRSSSGFNFRMSELQGAIGLAQLNKLDAIISSQRSVSEMICDAIRGIDTFLIRPSPEGSYETRDALVLISPTKEIALRARESLLNNNLSTKILPEAYTWHFSLTWDHIDQLSIDARTRIDLASSASLLERCLALPISRHMNEISAKTIYKSLQHSLK